MTNIIQYSKIEFTFVYRQASVMSWLKLLLQVWGKKLYLPIWCQKMVGKFDANGDMRGCRGTHERTILTSWWAHAPLLRRVAHMGLWWGWKRWVSLDGKLVYLAVPHPTCVAVGTCQGSCLGRVIDSDVDSLFYGPGDALGLPIHCGEAIIFDGMKCHTYSKTCSGCGKTNYFKAVGRSMQRQRQG